jgi:ankyrin repeat protein
MSSVQTGCKDIVELLLKNGADLNIQEENGKTALDLAAEIGLDDIVELLVENGTRSG